MKRTNVLLRQAVRRTAGLTALALSVMVLAAGCGSLAGIFTGSSKGGGTVSSTAGGSRNTGASLKAGGTTAAAARALQGEWLCVEAPASGFEGFTLSIQGNEAFFIYEDGFEEEVPMDGNKITIDDDIYSCTVNGDTLTLSLDMYVFQKETPQAAEENRNTGASLRRGGATATTAAPNALQGEWLCVEAPASGFEGFTLSIQSDEAFFIYEAGFEEEVPVDGNTLTIDDDIYTCTVNGDTLTLSVDMFVFQKKTAAPPAAGGNRNTGGSLMRGGAAAGAASPTATPPAVQGEWVCVEPPDAEGATLSIRGGEGFLIDEDGDRFNVTVDGNTITIDGDAVYTYTVKGKTLTLTWEADDDDVFVFQKK